MATIYRAALAVACILSLAAAVAKAQHPLLTRREPFVYSRRVDITSTMTLEEWSRRIYSDDSTLILLAVDSVGENYLRWVREQHGVMRFGIFTDGGERHPTTSTNRDFRPVSFATDTLGSPLDDEGRRQLGGLSRVNDGLSLRVIPAVWFLPAKLRGAPRGARLEQTYADEIPGEQFSGGQFKPTRISYKVQLRHAGAIDTLGRRVVRVEWRIDDLHYTTSSIRVADNGGDEEIEYTSDGSSSGTAYYALDTGMLLVMQGKGDLVMTAEDDDDRKAETRSAVTFVITRAR